MMPDALNTAPTMGSMWLQPYRELSLSTTFGCWPILSSLSFHPDRPPSSREISKLRRSDGGSYYHMNVRHN
ncbi:hypothetical protein AAC387_Pa05g0187 [Persea americana]